MADDADVAIVGAGPAGLAVAACLRAKNLSFVIFEREQDVGSSWRRHYERLHLHTIKQLSALPGLPFALDDPRYISRDRVIAYLEQYAAHFELRPHFGDAIHRVEREGNAWRVESTASTIHARDVVIASGRNSEPVTADIPGIASFQGRVLHSADYRRAEPFARQSVLVIGMGNTGAEIALDLAEGGASPTISIRNGVHIVPRDLFGIPIQLIAAYATGALPPRVADTVFPPILDLALGRPARYDIRRPSHGLLEQATAAGKIPVLDVGTVAKIRDGKIAVAPGISAVAANSVTFVDGSTRAFDAIVMATGYRANYSDFLHAEVETGEGGAPRSTEPTLHFVGFRSRVTGLLREIGREATRIAEEIAQRGR